MTSDQEYEQLYIFLFALTIGIEIGTIHLRDKRGVLIETLDQLVNCLLADDIYVPEMRMAA